MVPKEKLESGLEMCRNIRKSMRDLINQVKLAKEEGLIGIIYVLVPYNISYQ